MEKELKPIYTKLGLNITYYRNLADLSQEQLAEIIEISTTHMSKIETAATCLSVDVLIKISMALKVSIGKLFEIKD